MTSNRRQPVRPDWATVGAPVVIETTNGSWEAWYTHQHATVTKVTATQITVAVENSAVMRRFKLPLWAGDGVLEIGGDKYRGRVELVSATEGAKRIARAVMVQEHKTAASQARQLAQGALDAVGGRWVNSAKVFELANALMAAGAALAAAEHKLGMDKDQ